MEKFLLFLFSTIRRWTRKDHVIPDMLHVLKKYRTFGSAVMVFIPHKGIRGVVC